MKLRFSILLSCLVFFSATVAMGDDFYEGKTLRIIVSGAPGGGFDTYSRAIARHIGKYIPGNPTVIVQNMTGAGTRIAAKYLHSAAKPDGLTFGIINGYLLLGKALGMKGLDFDVTEYEWIGVPTQDHVVCAIHKDSGIDSLDEWMEAKEPLTLGGLGPANSTSDVPRLLRATVGLPIRVVEGYTGTSTIRLAAERGEVGGACWAWQSVKPTWAKALESGDVKVLIQATMTKHPDLPDVPVAADLVPSEEAKELLRAGVVAPSSITRVFLTTPGTPKDRVQILQQAFADTLKDPAFLAEAEKAQLEVNPLTGEEVKQVVDSLFAMSPEQVAKLSEILSKK